jgi:hypothetical protein
MKATSLYSIKEKAKAKLQTIQDKIDCNTEIAENNLGYELSRAIAGRDANEEHLRVAKELLQKCEDEELDVINMSEDSDETYKLQKEMYEKTHKSTVDRAKAIYDREMDILKASYDATLLKAESNLEKDMSLLDLKFKKQFGKAVKKTSERMTMLLQRVSRCEGALKVSIENVERLQNNKPKAVIRAEFEAKKPERDLAFVRTIEEMNAHQDATRDVKSSVAVESYPDNPAPIKPKKQVKKSIIPRPMPPETADERAWWGSVTGVNLDELANLKQLALAEDEAFRKSTKA